MTSLFNKWTNMRLNHELYNAGHFFEFAVAHHQLTGETKAPEYARILGQLWEDVVFRKMYVTGGIGTAQYGDEGFGDPYLLPKQTYCESCSSIAHVLWQHRMNLLTEDAKFVDVMELVLYNAALAGISLSGDGFSYQNPLTSSKGAQRMEWIGLACCPTNHARFTPQVGGLVYATGKGRIHVNLYAARICSAGSLRSPARPASPANRNRENLLSSGLILQS